MVFARSRGNSFAWPSLLWGKELLNLGVGGAVQMKMGGSINTNLPVDVCGDSVHNDNEFLWLGIMYALSMLPC